MASLVPNQSRTQLEEEERRRRLPYAPSMTGQSEQRVEQAILRANVDGEDPVEAAQATEGSAPDPRAIRSMLRAPMSDTAPAQSEPGSFQLRAPMSDAELGMAPPAQRLRAPGVSPAPTPDIVAPQKVPSAPQAPQGGERPEDERDRQRARRMAAAMGILRGTSAVMGLVGTAQGNDDVFDIGRAIAGVGGALPVTAPLEAIDRRAQERAEAEAAAQAYADRERTRGFEDEDRSIAGAERALNEEYRRTLMRSMDTNADRREFEMGRTGERDARNYDPASPTAQTRRDILRRIIATDATTQAAFGSADLEAMGANDLRQLADQVLRRIGQNPARRRGIDLSELEAIVDGLDEQAAPAAAPVAETLVQAAARELEANPPRSRIQRAREHVTRQQQPAAPVAAAPTNAALGDVLSVMNPEQPTGDPAAPAEPAPQARARRDRTLTQMIADEAAGRRGAPLPSGLERFDDYSPRELQDLARAQQSRNAGVRNAANRLSGMGTTSQEFGVSQPQTGVYTQADLARMREPVTQTRGLAADIDALVREYDRMAGGRGNQISQAQFETMLRGGVLSRLTSTERLSSLSATFQNAQLRERSGLAVTDNELVRSLRELNANTGSSPAAFREALGRARNRAFNTLETLRNSNPGAYDHLRGGPR